MPPATALHFKDGTGTQTLEPASQSSGTYAEFTQKIEQSATLIDPPELRRGAAPGCLNAIPDLPPKIAFAWPGRGVAARRDAVQI